MGGIGVLRAEEDDGVLLFSPLVHSERKKSVPQTSWGGSMESRQPGRLQECQEQPDAPL